MEYKPQQQIYEIVNQLELILSDQLYEYLIESRVTYGYSLLNDSLAVYIRSTKPNSLNTEDRPFHYNIYDVTNLAYLGYNVQKIAQSILSSYCNWILSHYIRKQ